MLPLSARYLGAKELLFILAFFVLSDVSLGVDGPSLENTEKYIVDQVSDNGEPSSVSCDNIIIRYINMRGRQRSLIFSPVEVIYSVRAGVNKQGEDIAPIDKVDHVVMRCVDRNCIRYIDENQAISAKVGSQRIMPATSASGLLKALNHHQALCGGVRKSLF